MYLHVDLKEDLDVLKIILLILTFLSTPSTICAKENANDISYSYLDTCPANINFELGNFVNWEANTGKVRLGPEPSNIITWDQSIWRTNIGLPIRHEIMDRNNQNPALDPYGNFPVNPPFGGGRYAVRLGTDLNDPLSSSPLPNALSEAIRYKITVPNNPINFGITFSYAVVFENPNHPNNLHTYHQQPRFQARMYEIGGDTLDCANFTFVASDPLPGFDTSAKYKIDSATGRFPGGINFAPVKYKPWSSVFVNLNKYAGKTFYLEFLTTDCTLRGHFGYAYVDVLECVIPIKAEIPCRNTTNAILSAPPGFKTYEWWNSNFSRKLGEGDTLRTTAVRENEKVNVILIPYDSYGCQDTLSTSVKVLSTSTPGVRYPTVYTLPNNDTQLQARNIGTNYFWQPSTGLNNSIIINPIFNFNTDVEYLINITDSKGCLTTDTVLIMVEEGPDVWIPDAFTPNNDGRNDKLEIFSRDIKEIHFWVFNRWGQLMFETKDPRQKWDGTYSGKAQPLETYVWVVEATTLTGKIIRKRGQTVLIR